jgi:hypothetical protein
VTGTYASTSINSVNKTNSFLLGSVSSTTSTGTIDVGEGIAYTLTGASITTSTGSIDTGESISYTINVGGTQLTSSIGNVNRTQSFVLSPVSITSSIGSIDTGESISYTIDVTGTYASTSINSVSKTHSYDVTGQALNSSLIGVSIEQSNNVLGIHANTFTGLASSGISVNVRLDGQVISNDITLPVGVTTTYNTYLELLADVTVTVPATSVLLVDKSAPSTLITSANNLSQSTGISVSGALLSSSIKLLHYATTVSLNGNTATISTLLDPIEVSLANPLPNYFKFIFDTENVKVAKFDILDTHNLVFDDEFIQTIKFDSGIDYHTRFDDEYKYSIIYDAA